MRMSFSDCCPESFKVFYPEFLATLTGVSPDLFKIFPLIYSVVVCFMQQIVTRLDIAFQVGVLARYVSQPCKHHLRAAHRVLNYLNLNPAIVAHFGANAGGTQPSIEAFNQGGSGYEMPVEAYSDADWAGCPESRRSTS